MGRSVGLMACLQKELEKIGGSLEQKKSSLECESPVQTHLVTKQAFFLCAVYDIHAY